MLKVDTGGFLQTSLSILDACWTGNPSLRLGTTCHPKERLQRLTDAILPRVEKRMTQTLAEHFSKEKVELILAEQLMSDGASDFAGWHVQQLWISLQDVLILDRQLKLQVNLSVDLMQNMVPQQIALPAVEFYRIDGNLATKTLFEVSYQEINHWIADNLSIINEQLTLPSDILSLILSSKGRFLVCTLQLKASPESTFQIRSSLTLNRDLQLLELEEVEISAVEETGLLVKTILRSTRRFIQSKIKKSFPINLKPLQSHLERLLAAHTPTLVKSSIPTALVWQSMQFGDTCCSLVLDGQVKLAMVDYLSTVTDPDLG